jgi:hypothetical protein
MVIANAIGFAWWEANQLDDSNSWLIVVDQLAGMFDLVYYWPGESRETIVEAIETLAEIASIRYDYHWIY